MNAPPNLIICCVLLTTACGYTGGNHLTPPTAAQSAFAQRFRNAQGVKWKEEEGSVLEAEFVQDGNNYSANYSMDVTWKVTEQTIAEKELPEAVHAIMGARHLSAVIKKAEREITPDADLYEVELRTHSGKVEMMLTAEGVVIQEIAK